MGVWIDAVESKARVIHEQLSVARRLAESTGENPDLISAPYLELLRKLYEDEFAFAHLADTSDLVARFTGPAVSGKNPTVTIVAGVFTNIRNQIRGIAKSIVGLTGTRRLRWPSELDPHLSGLAHGSLVVGVCIPAPVEEDSAGQTSILGVSEQVYESVRSAVRSLATVARYIEQDRISEEIRTAFPDPAVRDTVMVAASKLAPSGRQGIESVAFSSPEETPQVSATLTPLSRRILNQSLSKPVRVSGQGVFQGVVREIDLDAHRFELRRVQGTGAIRCVYGPGEQELVRTILDAQISVDGSYEESENEQPRLISVSSIEVLRSPEEQLDMDWEGEH